jgi:hypothetical protein
MCFLQRFNCQVACVVWRGLGAWFGSLLHMYRT